MTKSIAKINKSANLSTTKYGDVSANFDPLEHADYQPLNVIWGALVGSPMVSGETKYLIPKGKAMMISADGLGAYKISIRRADVHRACADYMRERGIMPVKTSAGAIMYPTTDLIEFVWDYTDDIKRLIDESEKSDKQSA